RKRVQGAPHAALQRAIDELMLLHARLALEGGRFHRSGVMVAVAGKVLDLDLGIGERLLDQRLDLGLLHGHRSRVSERVGEDETSSKLKAFLSLGGHPRLIASRVKIRDAREQDTVTHRFCGTIASESFAFERSA